MSEPRRWKDAPDAPVGMRDLLRSARPTRPLEHETFDRGERRVAKLAFLPASIVVFGVWSKLAVAGSLGLAMAAAVIVVEARRGPATTAATPTAVVASARASAFVVPAPAPSVEVDRAPGAAESATLVPTTPNRPRLISTATSNTRTTKSETRGTALPAPATDLSPMADSSHAAGTLGAELALLEDARRQMLQHPDAALSRIAEHRAAYPTGALSVERDLMEIEALRRMGRVRDARSSAESWLLRDPTGIHAAKVRALLLELE